MKGGPLRWLGGKLSVFNLPFGKRFYILFFVKLKTRKLVHFNITTNPNTLFINQQLQAVIWESWEKDEKIHLIHDNDILFKPINFESFNIKSVRTSWKSPNINAVAERFIRSLRQEALNNFIIFNADQLRNMVKQYQEYYNSQRPHQGIGQDTPKGYQPQTDA